MMKKTSALIIYLFLISISISAKKASAIWYFLAPSSEYNVEDDNIAISYEIYTHSICEEYSLGPNPFMRVTYTNKTDIPIYIDLASSFILINDNSYPMYVPTATSTTVGRSVGVGVNVGAVAGALGVSGIAGDVLNGVNVGGDKYSQVTSIVYAQRILIIPPKSSSILEDIQMFKPGTEKALPGKIYFREMGHGKYKRLWCLSYKFSDLNSGDLRSFSEETSPFTIGAYSTYSFDQNFDESKGMKAVYYVSKIVGSVVWTFPIGANKEYTKIDKTFPGWRESNMEIIRLWAR